MFLKNTINATSRLVPLHKQLRLTNKIMGVSRRLFGDTDARTFDENPPADISNIPLEEIDISNPFLVKQGKWQAYFKRLREESPVHYTPKSPFGPFWSVTLHEDVGFVDRNHDLFTAAPYIVLGEPPTGLIADTFIANNPPIHTARRKAVQAVVGPQNLKEFEGLIRKRTQKLLDSLPVNQPFDWVQTVSVELTSQMLATLMDFPFEERHNLIAWSDCAVSHDKMTGGGVDVHTYFKAAADMLEAFTNLWHEKKAKRDRGEPLGFDAMSLMLQNEKTKDLAEKKPIEFIGDLALLIVGGNDTTRNSMTGGVWAFHQYPEELQKLKDNPDLMPNAVSEIIRWQTPLAYMRRVALQDVEMRGKTIRKGDKVLMWYVSANRDESVFEDADRLKIDRSNARNHLSFGSGIHRCMGNRVADMQLMILWQEILARFDRVEVLEAPTPTRSNFVKGYHSMSVKLHPKTS